MIAYTGSLLKPVYRYLVKMHFNLGQDRRGGALADEMHRELFCLSKKYVQPNLEIKYGPDFVNYETSIYFKYINGWEHTMKLGTASAKDVKYLMEYYNEIIECDRAEKGQDDEPEDEDSHL